MNYWIFQCKEDAYHFETANEENVLNEWKVKQYKKDIKEGDKGIIWITGKKAGCYALVNVLSNPDILGISQDHHLWNEANETGLRLKREDATALKVRIETTILRSPLLNIELKFLKGMENFRAGKPGSYGTNIPMTNTEYQIICHAVTCINS